MEAVAEKKEILLQALTTLKEANSPKIILREAVNNNLINQNEIEILIEAVDNRNLASHTYREALAELILDGIPEFYELMKKITDRLPV